MITEVESTFVKQWHPNKGKQELYASLPDSIFEAFYGGAAGGGKSEILMMLPLLKQWYDNKRFQGIILRRTYRELEESLIERSKRGGNRDAQGNETPSFTDFGASYNEQHKRWRFPSGATISFGHAEEESDVRKYDTAEFQYLAFDELTSFTEFQYSFLAFSRCRSSDPSLPAVVRSASNPGNVGHGWVRKRFVEPCKEGGKILVQRIEGREIKRIFIQAFLSDNPILMKGDPLYLARLHMLPEAEKRAKLYGDWWTFSGQVFDEWRMEPFADEPAEAQHVIPSMRPDSWLPRVLAIDWGYAAMTYALWGAAYPNKTAIAYRELSRVKTSIETWATEVANICLEEGILPALIVIDPSAWQNRGSQTIADQFADQWNKIVGKPVRIEKAVNDRLGGKMLVHDYLRWKPLPAFVRAVGVFDRDKADWILRNSGLEAYKRYLASFAPQDTTVPEIRPRLHVTTDCPLLIKTIPLCVYDDKEHNIEDVKEFNGDDPYDDIRYFLNGCEFLYSTAASNSYVEEKKQEILNAYATSGDTNSFYRKMEVIEAKQRQQWKGIRLGRRRR